MPIHRSTRTAKPSCAIATATASERLAAAALPLLVATLLAAASFAAFAQKPNIYSCDVGGRRVTSDRPIPECNAREQKRLNADGSVAEIVRPSMTADERAEYEQKERDAKADRDKLNDAIRRDRNLVQRYPNEAVHNKARQKALAELDASVRSSEKRLAELNVERKEIDDEKEFYKTCLVERTKKGDCAKPGYAEMPAKLKLRIDANDAGLEAQNTLIQNFKTESVRVNKIYDEELKRLRALWGGAAPGSLPPIPTRIAAEPAKSNAR